MPFYLTPVAATELLTSVCNVAVTGFSVALSDLFLGVTFDSNLTFGSMLI